MYMGKTVRLLQHLEPPRSLCDGTSPCGMTLRKCLQMFIRKIADRWDPFSTWTAVQLDFAPVLGVVAAFLPTLGRSGHPPPARLSDARRKEQICKEMDNQKAAKKMWRQNRHHHHHNHDHDHDHHHHHHHHHHNHHDHDHHHHHDHHHDHHHHHNHHQTGLNPHR